MSLNNKNILRLTGSELLYNRLLIILPVSLLPMVFLVVLLSIIMFNVDKPVYFISPVIIIGAFAAGIWMNRIKEQRERFFMRLPVRRNDRGLARIFTYITVIVILFLILVTINELVYKSSDILYSNPFSEIMLVFAVLGLSLIVQDFRYCIKQKYDRYWIIFTLLLLVIITALFIVLFIKAVSGVQQVSINKYFFLHTV